MFKLIGAIIVIASGMGLFVFQSLFTPVKADGAIQFTIDRGTNLNEASAMLQQKGIVGNAFIFKTFVKMRYPRMTVKAGTYHLPSAVTAADIAERVIAGMPRPEMNVTIIEGWTIQDIVTQLSEKGFRITEQDFVISDDMRDTFTFLKNVGDGKNLEGYLFPDTYQLFSDATPSEIIEKMLSTFDKRVTRELREAAKARQLSLNEVVTLASIIEREVQTEADRRIVADLFLRRLDIGMALQADSTVNYVTGKKTPSASASDIRVDSAYNTYRYKGLPPGPIGNPGLSAIKAVIAPQPNEYLFFLTTPKGKAIYSKTFAEHVRNKGMYLR